MFLLCLGVVCWVVCRLVCWVLIVGSWHEVGLFAGFGLLAVYVLWYLLLGFCAYVDFAGF